MLWCDGAAEERAAPRHHSPCAASAAGLMPLCSQHEEGNSAERLESCTTTSVLESLSLECARLQPTYPSASTSNTWQMLWPGRPAVCAIPHGLQNHGVNLTHQILRCPVLEGKRTPEREREGSSAAATSACGARWASLLPDARESGSSVTLCFLDSTFGACHSAKAQLFYKAFNWKCSGWMYFHEHPYLPFQQESCNIWGRSGLVSVIAQTFAATQMHYDLCLH